jgi:disulfide bond formation protein DsbB
MSAMICLITLSQGLSLMTTRSIRLVAYLLALLALGTGVSLAASGPAKVAAANPAPVAFCPTESESCSVDELFTHQLTIGSLFTVAAAEETKMATVTINVAISMRRRS